MPENALWCKLGCRRERKIKKLSQLSSVLQVGVFKIKEDLWILKINKELVCI